MKGNTELEITELSINSIAKKKLFSFIESNRDKQFTKGKLLLARGGLEGGF